ALSDAWMTMPLPGPDGPGASVAGGTSFVVFRKSQHKDAAWKLVAFLSDPEVQVQFHGLTGNLPPRRSPWEDPELAGDRYARAFRDQLERAVPTPKVPEWERIATELKLVGELVANGRLDVDQAAAELDRRTDAILEKRRWMLEQQGDRPAAGSGGDVQASAMLRASRLSRPRGNDDQEQRQQEPRRPAAIIAGLARPPGTRAT